MENKVVNEVLARSGLEEENMQPDVAKSKENKSMPTCYSSRYIEMQEKVHICPCIHARSVPEMEKQFEIVKQILFMPAVAHCNISEEEEEEEEEEDEEEKAIFKLATEGKETAFSMLKLFMLTRKRAARLAKKNGKEAKLSQNSDMLPEF